MTAYFVVVRLTIEADDRDQAMAAGEALAPIVGPMRFAGETATVVDVAVRPSLFPDGKFPAKKFEAFEENFTSPRFSDVMDDVLKNLDESSPA